MTWAFRQLTPEDQPAYRDLRLLGLRLYPDNFLSDYESEAARPVAADAERLAFGKMHGAFAGDDLVAMSLFSQEPHSRAAHRGYIGAFIVHPDHQGGGVGRALMHYLKDTAQQRGVWQLELYVNGDNLRAKGFYAALGFREKGVLPNAIIASTGPQDDLFMVCDLRD